MQRVKIHTYTKQLDILFCQPFFLKEGLVASVAKKDIYSISGELMMDANIVSLQVHGIEHLYTVID